VPEGDTLHRAAAGLRPVLVGNPVTGFKSPVAGVGDAAGELVGKQILAVEAEGKHLLIRFEGGIALRTHLRMTGSWHLYHPGDEWKKPQCRARVVLETERAVAVCFNAPEVEILRGRAAAPGSSGLTGRVGLDLLTPDVEPEDVVARWRTRPELPIGVAVMRQYLAAGIGNVYKSEVLFLCRVDPFRRVSDFGDDALSQIAVTAQREMRRTLKGGPRTIRRALDGGRYWVYGRGGKRCYECGERIAMRRQGDDGRSTYFCPHCQGVDVV
jgi:endonuclease-8